MSSRRLQVTLSEARRRFSELMRLAAQGTSILVLRPGRSPVCISPHRPSKPAAPPPTKVHALRKATVRDIRAWRRRYHLGGKPIVPAAA